MATVLEQRAERRAESRSLRRLGHRPVLDGLRGLAFLLVFVGHAQWLPMLRPAETAMFLFFALSGFLITELLLEERARTDRVSLTKFFARRALRLLPALACFLAVWLLVVTVFAHHAPWLVTAPGSRRQHHKLATGHALKTAAYAIGYVSNWMQINGRLGGTHQPLTHLWSLSVEEQFYLIWAPLLATVLWLATRVSSRRTARRVLAVLAGALAVGSLVDDGWHYFMANGVHLARVAYGTDTRAGAFLLGGVAAIAWSNGWLRRAGAAVTRRLRGGLAAGAPARLAAVVVTSALVALLLSGRVEGDAQGVLSKTLSYAAATAAAPLLVVSLVEAPGTVVGRVLSHPAVTYLGRRSYALYLWHYVFLTWFHDLGLPGELLAFAASVAAAELSWRLVESRALAAKGRLTRATSGAS